MSVVQHAALHVQGQHIIWHRVFMDLKDTFTAAPCQRVGLAKDLMHLTQKSNPWQPRMITLHYITLRLRGCRGRPDQRGGLDRVQLGPAFVEIGLTQLGDLILFGTSAVSVLVVEHVYHLHSLSIDVAERCKALPVEPRVVAQIDEDLRRAGIWHARFRIRQVAALVGLCDRLILNIGLLPCGRNRRIGADAKLNDEAGHNAEETGVVIEVVLNQIVEAVGADGSPSAIDSYNKISSRRRESYPKHLRRFVLQERRAKKCAVVTRTWCGRKCAGGCFLLCCGGRWRFCLWSSRGLGLGLFRRGRFRSLFFRLTAEKQRSHCYNRDKPLCAFHFLTSPYASFSNFLRCFYFPAFNSRLTRSTSVITRRVFSPRIFFTSPSE